MFKLLILILLFIHAPISYIYAQTLLAKTSAGYAGAGRITGTVTKANMRLSIIDGTAFADFSAANTLTPYLGYKLVVTDSAGKKLSGYVKAAGSSETLGAEILANTGFADTTGITDVSGVSASVEGGQSGNALQVTDGGSAGGFVGEIGLTVTSGKLVKYSVYTKKGTGTAGLVNVIKNADPWTTMWTSDYTTDADWTQRTGYGTSLYDSVSVVYYSIEASKTALYDTATLKQVTAPSATGVTIVSTKGGTTYNWESEEAGFNRNDTSGYKYELFK